MAGDERQERWQDTTDRADRCRNRLGLAGVERRETGPEDGDENWERILEMGTRDGRRESRKGKLQIEKGDDG